MSPDGRARVSWEAAESADATRLKRVSAHRKGMDIYDYLDAIARHWGWVLGLSMLAVVVAAVVNSFIPPTYEATAILSTPKLNSSISCASLIKSLEVETQVIAALSARASLFPAEQVPERIIQRVDVTEGQNVIRITVRSDTPRKAALIANTWADFAIERISEAQLGEQQQLKIGE